MIVAVQPRKHLLPYEKWLHVFCSLIWVWLQDPAARDGDDSGHLRFFVFFLREPRVYLALAASVPLYQKRVGSAFRMLQG